ncbi:aldose 1-epimerase family protein [Microbacterium sp. zg.Y1090]|uniref:aldose 1-epimerase family protein n=1 Tax=Microbacterium wangruii TaxID=3049073 RepID=UPI00214AECDD|nr:MULTISPECIES: aldose 1-epimerase family protein [unclassified Microbacterium]MCR2817768.1 aldose 1-epimerase family protein [Microbacterium sp. zg.Y1090]MDL5485588.1 aldose 1-epimerase family protein [Microbacterium sp. zg-Y1211]WIM28759.1 aldose 1-epimerase family protein [Microbacterium sp. zg-Y1090]
MAHLPASGTQHTLRRGACEVVVASVGASLRSFTHSGRDLVVPFDADEVRPAYRGATLAPWPNRVVDGRYAFGGTEQQLPLTEPERGHALHGLAAWLDFEPVDKGPDHVTLAATVEPQTGYPWRVRVQTTFALGDDGLTQTVRAQNLSAGPVPFGTGPHPYLVAGEGTVDDWTLELPASEVLSVTPDRLVPTTLGPVDEAFDFRAPRAIGATEIDHAFTGLAPGDDGVTTVRVTAADGRGAGIAWDAACSWVQVHTADRPDGAADPSHRIGLAVEPMTCAPDAFNAPRYGFDTGLLVIEPGATAEASWRIFAI